MVRDCSGHGELLGGVCVCDSGWSDVGDFSPVSGLDCGIHVESVLALAAVSLFFGVIAQVVFMGFLWTTATGPVPPKRDGPSQKLRFAIVYSIQTAFCNIYDVAQIVNHREATYGGSIYITVLMAIAYATAYGGTVVFFEAVMKLLSEVCKSLTGEAQERVDRSTKVFYGQARYLYAICALTGLVTLVSLVVPPGVVHVVCRATFAMWCVFHVLFVICFNPPINLIRAELQPFIALLDRNAATEQPLASSKTASSSSSQQLKLVRFHLLAAQICVNFVMVLTTVVYVLWASWDTLIRKAVYVIMYCTLGVHIMSVPMLMALAYKGAAPRDPNSATMRTLRSAPIDKPQFSGQPIETGRGVPSHYAVHSRNSSFYVLPGPDSEAHQDLYDHHDHQPAVAVWAEEDTEEVAEGMSTTAGEEAVA